MDNSEYQRNGDFSPSRLVQQREVINHVSLSKTESNMESTVGLLTMGGSVKVLCAPSRNLAGIMGEIKKVRVEGTCDFIAGIRTAQLALKNRQNKKQHPRIVVFVGSPIECEEKALKKLGGQLKKNSFAVDVVNFGSENTANQNKKLLETFINAVNNEENSHLVHVAPEASNLSDVVVSSPVLGNAPRPAGFGSGNSGWQQPSGGAAGVATGAGGLGADQSEDQMIAYAKRISMEEARSAAAAKEAKTETKAEDASMDVEEDEEEEYDEDAELARAMALSMAMADDDEDEDGAEEEGEEGAGDVDDEILQVFQDDNFIEDLIDSTGVQKDDIDIQQILEFKEDENKEDKNKEESKK
jgi:26S proteasome regulatory subunit N10